MKNSPSHRGDLPEVAEQLRRRSRKLTGPRQAILQLLREEPHPLSSKEIFGRLAKGDCDLATVYRLMHLLESMGAVNRFDFGDGVARYELVRAGEGHHHHLICTHCSGVVEIAECFPAALEKEIGRKHGFKNVTHKLEFFGLCPQCQTRSGVS